jgi:hypothetical protein
MDKLVDQGSTHGVYVHFHGIWSRLHALHTHKPNTEQRPLQSAADS